MTSNSIPAGSTLSHLIVAVTLVLSLPFLGLRVLAAEKEQAHDLSDSLGSLMNEIQEMSMSFDSTTTLEDYLGIAMKRSPVLRSAYNRWVADLKKSDYAGSLPDPVFSYGYFIERVETRVGPQEQRFSLRQSFPWFGTLGARENMAFAMSQASYHHFEASRLELFFEIKAAYYDYYLLGQDLLITRENLELLKFWESVAQSRYKVGLKQHPDVIKAQVELGKLEDHLRTLQEQRVPKAARLRALLNLPEDIVLPIPSSISVVEAPLVEDSVINLIRQYNPDLKALEKLIERERAGERLAGKQALPSFSIGVDYIQTGKAVNSDVPESGKDPWMVGASVSLPIWFGKNSARSQEARARRRAAEYDLQDTENQLAAMTERLLFEYSDALRKIRLYRDGLVPKAQQSLNANYTAYQAGETDFLNVLDAQRQLLDFQLTVARQQTALATKRAQLEMLGGTELEMYMQNQPNQKE
jgi:cobalt-zinc-cadmium efflux system outer membrane protein